MKNIIRSFFLPAEFFLLVQSVSAGSIGLRFANLTLENLKPGQTVSISQAKGLPFTILNKNDTDGIFEVAADFPAPGSLKEGYEQVPDPSWIRAVPSKLRIGPRDEGKSDILLEIPDDPRYSGRHYQVNLTAKRVSQDAAGGMVVAGEASVVLLFNVGAPSPLTRQEAGLKKSVEGVDFDLAPSSLYAMDVPPGRKYDLLEQKGKCLLVTNRNSRGMAFSFSCLPGASPAGGYEQGNPVWISFRKKVLKIGRRQVGEAVPVIEIPAGPEYAGKKYVFDIYCRVLNVDTVLSGKIRLFVATAGR